MQSDFEKTISKRASKLFDLVENGISYGVKKAAATQIFQYYKHHTDELCIICDRIAVSILHKSCDTRQATAHLIDLLSQAHKEDNLDGNFHSFDLYSFSSIDLQKITQSGKPLLASAGKEFDIEFDGMSVKERIAFQRKQLKDRLGFVEALGDSTADLIADEDLLNSPSSKGSVAENSSTLIDMSTLSARERAQLKRKNKKMVITDKKKVPSTQLLSSTSNDSLVTPSAKEQPLWPFYNLCESMIQNIFNPIWYVRHGACLGLRSLIKNALFDYNFCYKTTSSSSELGAVVDLLVRLNCLLALDKFTDFVQTQATVVVRDICGQLIGTICHCLCKYAASAKTMATNDSLKFQVSSSLIDDLLKKEIEQLGTLIQPGMEWQVRLSGLIALKYVFCVVEDGKDFVTPELSHNLEKCLEYDDEDVRSFACDIFKEISKRKSLIEKKQDAKVFEILAKNLRMLLDSSIIDDSDIISSASLASTIQLLTAYWELFGTDDIFWSILRFIRHPNVTIRQECIEIIHRSPPSDTQKLVRFLAEFIILEEKLQLKSFAAKILSSITVDFPSFLSYSFPILFTPIEKPFKKDMFISIAAFSLDLFFKHADLLIHGYDFLLSSRILLASSIQKPISFSDQLMFPDNYKSYEQKLTILLILLNSNSSSSSLDEFLKAKDFDVKFVDRNEQSIAALECCYICKGMSLFSNTHVKVVMNALKSESNELLQRIFASKIADWIISTENPKLLSMLSALFRSNKLLCPDIDIDPNIKMYSLHISSVIDSSTYVDIPSRGASFVIESVCGKKWDFLLFDFSIVVLQSTSYDELLGGIAISGCLLKCSANISLPFFLQIFSFLNHQHAAIRYAAASAISHVSPSIIYHLIECLTSALADPSFSLAGIVELISIFEQKNIFSNQLYLPFVLFFVTPILRSLCSNYAEVRTCAYQSFSSLLSLTCLFELNEKEDPFQGKTMSSGITFFECARREYEFLQELFNLQLLVRKPLQLPSTLKFQLRPYQIEGVKWLMYLHKYGLNGALCDDMGLGKTIQTLVAISLSATLPQPPHSPIQQNHYNGNSGNTESMPSLHPSLIVCPSTLIGHWENEITQNFRNILYPIPYSGTSMERRKKRSILSGPFPVGSVIITSYDTVRNDLELFSQFHFNYCVLDEGHIIKNAKTKLSQAVKSLQASHRLLLSGTPIQNNILELWSLFDFLMPGFLGTEQWFNAKYARAVQSSRDAKSSSAEFDAAEKALDSLHQQTLPFIMRRLKEDVLKDLPPKIIQDYPITMTSLQRCIYQKYASSLLSADVENGKSNIFKTLVLLSRLSLHPSLVFPTPESYQSFLQRESSSIDDSANSDDFLSSSPKLIALREILQECNVHLPYEQLDEDPHRVLIFAQHKSTLDVIEKHVLLQAFPNTLYSRLDGSVPSEQRFIVASQFNSDPSKRIMLLTTHVGGLGLNLTGADNVIFFEHDWNPMKDLQAMDRAHRLGQNRTVNVYRLIMSDTIEERIMGSQKFKLFVAGSVINQQNVAISSMCQSDGSTSQNSELDVAELLCLQSRDKKSESNPSKKIKLNLNEILQEIESSSNDTADDNENIESFEQFLLQ